MDIHGYGYPWIWISMDINRKSVDMDMDTDVKLYIHGNPGYCVKGYSCYKRKKMFVLAVVVVALAVVLATQATFT